MTIIALVLSFAVPFDMPWWAWALIVVTDLAAAETRARSSRRR